MGENKFQLFRVWRFLRFGFRCALLCWSETRTCRWHKVHGSNHYIIKSLVENSDVVFGNYFPTPVRHCWRAFRKSHHHLIITSSSKKKARHAVA